MNTNENLTAAQEAVNDEYQGKVARVLDEVLTPLREQAIALMAEYVLAAGLTAAYRAECIIAAGGDPIEALTAIVAGSEALTLDLEQVWPSKALDLAAQGVGTQHPATAEILGYNTPTV